ncbi:SCO family protein [Sorangium sp. So ce394]|uniref:SCO family protein n=1 Tax=Sorangium sp. So ce394 TaxID=3133310 RepID=UPI003F5B6867
MPNEVLCSTSPGSSSAGDGAPARRRGRLRPVRIGLWVSALAGLAVFGAVSRAREAPASPPVLGEMPAFSMTDQDGRPVTRESLRGQTLIVDFFYASCPVSCPRLSAQMAAFQERLAQRGEARGQALPIHLISITLDPENDTPDVLRSYAARYSSGRGAWSFLSGRSEELNRVVVKGFKVRFERADPSAGLGAIMHGEWFVLVDGQGRIRGYYQIGDEERMNELVRDAERLASKELT